MHAQLEAIRDGLAEAQGRLYQLRETVPEHHWHERLQRDRWSISECVAHLNLTTRAFEPVVSEALQRGRAMSSTFSRRYRLGLMGWIVWRASGLPVRWRFRAPAGFVPTDGRPVAQLIAEFDELQTLVVSWLERADGLPLHRVRITSPVDSRVRYSLYACLAVFPRHQQRHLWQAEQVWHDMQLDNS